jgi:hypothetical protein
MTITLDAPTVAGGPFPGCAPWCNWEHSVDEDPDSPDACFAEDIDVPFRGREISAAMSYDPGRAADGKPEVSVTVFLASRDILDAPSFTDLDEAEAAAYALLAQIAVARGETAKAEQHKRAALAAARSAD